MLRIGDFGRIARVSVQTLRHYDDLGLLKPVEVDAFTGYRYYAFDQLPRLHRILALKDLGLSLEEIGRLMQEELSAEQLRGMLRLKEAELRERVDEEATRLERVRARLRQLEKEQIMPNYEVVLKRLEPIQVAGVRGKIPTYPEQGHLWEASAKHLAAHNITPSGACFTLYYSDEPDIDAEVCEPVTGKFADGGEVKFHTLPAVDQAACVVHSGPFATIGEAYGHLTKWMETNGYECVGPVREVYLRPAQMEGKAASQNDPGTVTEIQYPARKKK
jgi:DNA-binding transcriptional MerR regulator